MKLTFRRFEWTDADIVALITVRNAGSADNWTKEEILDQRSTHPVFLREFVIEEERIIGSAFYEGDPESGAFEIGLRLVPDARMLGYELPLIERTIKQAREHGAKQLTFSARSDCPGPSDALRALGFECIHRDPISELDLTTFDMPTPQLPEGIRLVSISKVQEEISDWKKRVCELRNTLIQDVHLPDPMRPWVEEDLTELTLDRYWFPDGWIVALDGDAWVGLTFMIADLSKQEAATIALTGVLPSHRKRGIATALKIVALINAKAAGIECVRTDNEEHNPMLALNKRLGFREVYAYEVYRKELSAS